MPRGGVEQGPPVFTPRRDKTAVCGCTVGSSAFKTHRRPKKHSSPEVPRIGHSCYITFAQGSKIALVYAPQSGKMFNIRRWV